MIRFALSQDQIAIVERLVATGRFDEPHGVIGAALALLETRERERLDCLAALHEALSLKDGEAQDDFEPQDDAEANGDAEHADAGQPVFADAPSLDDDAQPFDAAALDEIERLIASKAAVAKPAGALV